MQGPSTTKGNVWPAGEQVQAVQNITRLPLRTPSEVVIEKRRRKRRRRRNNKKKKKKN
ncbi:hypothetical protein DPMN_182497 [Dreissena polymorpha]|uniref:Uncharacterized protein n=1 Tax=Dreissena polymorpha TaxID=45954 RepID=A0A9D4I4M8_DREPO|nr:hypothetical protein DPMN_182497 [Dreissena polymorpha]